MIIDVGKFLWKTDNKEIRERERERRENFSYKL